MAPINSNYIKSGSTIQNAITKNTTFNVGATGGDDYGPTNQTGFYKGIIPPSGGYTIYMHKESQGPSIHVAYDDEQCIFFLKSFGATGSTISDVLAWSTGRTDIWVQTQEITLQDLPNNNSLLVYLDSGNSSSYNGSGNIWYDLQGGNDATLFNTPTYSSNHNGILNFNDSSLEYGTIPNLGDLNTWTVEVWFRISSTLSTGKVTSIISNQYNLSDKLNFSIGTNNAPNNYNLSVGFYDGAWRSTTGFVPQINTWYQVVGTYDGSTLKQYINGNLSGGTLNYVGSSQSGGEIRLMRRWDSSLTSNNMVNGDLAIVKIYNTAISSENILQNYNNTYTRFNTPSTSTPTPIPSTNTPTPQPTDTPTPTPTAGLIASNLLIHLDAYENNSYPGSGTTVYDLSNSYDHSLLDSSFTTLNGIKCFDCSTGTNRVAVNGTGPTLPTSGYTYITWARLINNNSGFRTLLYVDSPKYTPITIPNGTNTLGYWDSAFRSSGYDLSSSVDVWVQYAIVGDDSSQTFYINGSQVGSSISYGSGGRTHWGWGNNDGASQPFGHVANLYLYNKKLSPSEITQMYNFLSPRFVESTPTPTPTITNTPIPATSTPTPQPTDTPTPTPTVTSTPTPTIISPVSSGLELYYDPSNSLSYPGSGTTLYDLSDSAVNATISGSPTDSGNWFTFTGTQSIQTGNLAGLYSGWQHTLEIWFNASAAGSVFSDTGTGPTNTGYHSTGLEVYQTGPFYLTNAMLYSGSSINRVGGGTVSLNTWYQLVRVYNGSNLAYAYLNKVKSSDTSITWTTPTPGWYLNFGSSDTTKFANGNAFQGKIGVIRLYNRVLTQSEVTQNFDAEKSKYGL